MNKSLNQRDVNRAFINSTKRIGKETKKYFRLNFNEQGSLLTSGGWVPRKDSKPHPILNKTGKLKSKFSVKTSRTKAIVTNNTPYAKFHQEGMGFNPTRKIVGDSPQLRKKQKDIIREEFKKIFRLK